jgi:hypothetical protein
MRETVQYATITEVAREYVAPTYGSSTGYGRKIPTRYLVRTREGDARWRRVYVMNYGNVGSAYVVVRGKELFIRDSDLA